MDWGNLTNPCHTTTGKECNPDFCGGSLLLHSMSTKTLIHVASYHHQDEWSRLAEHSLSWKDDDSCLNLLVCSPSATCHCSASTYSATVIFFHHPIPVVKLSISHLPLQFVATRREDFIQAGSVRLCRLHPICPALDSSAPCHITC